MARTCTRASSTPGPVTRTSLWRALLSSDLLGSRRAAKKAEQHRRVYVSRCFDGSSRHGKNIVLNKTVHASDADGGQEPTNGGWNQADQQRDEHEHGLRGPRVDRERLQGHNCQKKDNRQS